MTNHSIQHVNQLEADQIGTSTHLITTTSLVCLTITSIPSHLSNHTIPFSHRQHKLLAFASTIHHTGQAQGQIKGEAKDNAYLPEAPPRQFPINRCWPETPTSTATLGETPRPGGVTGAARAGAPHPPLQQLETSSCQTTRCVTALVQGICRKESQPYICIDNISQKNPSNQLQAPQLAMDLT